MLYFLTNEFFRTKASSPYFLEFLFLTIFFIFIKIIILKHFGSKSNKRSADEVLENPKKKNKIL
jgi:hypothetical protein